MRIQPSIEQFFLITFMLISATASALSTDPAQPIEIEADAAELDDNTGITIYSGNVIVTQGSMVMRGNKLTITYMNDNSLKTAIMVGNPATFKQLPDNQAHGEINGKGIKIDYLALEDKLVMTEEAELTQKGKLFRAYKIEYDVKAGKMIARKAVTGEATPSGKAAKQGSGRIKVILPPKQK